MIGAIDDWLESKDLIFYTIEVKYFGVQQNLSSEYQAIFTDFFSPNMKDKLLHWLHEDSYITVCFLNIVHSSIENKLDKCMLEIPLL